MKARTIDESMRAVREVAIALAGNPYTLDVAEKLFTIHDFDMEPLRIFSETRENEDAE